jgi:nucleotidyltransferase/DNA polymerase involved in DNA repair
MSSTERCLGDLVSVGPAMLRDLELLGIRTVAQLARQKPERLYEKLCRVTGRSQDICCLDVFSAAVAQARNPRLPAAQRQWWYWSRKRKARDRNQARGRLA